MVRAAIVSNKALMIGDDEGVVKKLDLAKAEIENSLDAHFEVLGDMSVKRSAQYIVTGSWDSTIKVWDMRSGQVKRKIIFNLPVLTAQAHDSNQLILAGATDLIMQPDELVTASFHLYDLQTGKGSGRSIVRSGLPPPVSVTMAKWSFIVIKLTARLSYLIFFSKRSLD
jgi:WD40 repeat protein